MIHELLLALRGHIGGLFVLQNSKIKVVSVPFLNPGEESLLNKICENGSLYLCVQEFISKYQHFRHQLDERPGLYMNLFVMGLEDVLLPYDRKIEELEREALLDSAITLTFIQTELLEFTHLVRALRQLVSDVERRKLRGCQLLNMVHKHSHTGTESVKIAMQALQFTLHKVLYGQLTSWLLYGVLDDPYFEFFIHKTENVRQTTVPQLNQDEELGITGLSGDQIKQLQQSMLTDEELPEGSISSSEEFRLRSEMLPLYIPDEVLRKIVFIGESVDMFENNTQDRDMKSILKDKAHDYCTVIHNLSQEPVFDVLNFETVIDKIRESVAERLWVVVVQDARLLEALTRIKEIFLLGRCDIFLTLNDEADKLLSCPPGPMTNIEILRVFRRVLADSNMEDDDYQRFSITVDKKDGAAKTKQNGWNLLLVKYEPTSPLHLFFTPLSIERYNIVFRFLLSVRRVHNALHNTWFLLQNYTQTSEDTFICELRNHMMFLVNILQYYLQVDVIESQFSQLLSKIELSRDFEVIRHCHETFVANLLSQCFLLNVPVNHCITRILEGCQSFCATVRASLEDGGSISTDQMQHVLTLQSMFRKQTLLLFKILNSSKTHQHNPFLVQLLLKINYNRYFNDAGQMLGGI